jgi:hypothetical protein
MKVRKNMYNHEYQAVWVTVGWGDSGTANMFE